MKVVTQTVNGDYLVELTRQEYEALNKRNRVMEVSDANNHQFLCIPPVTFDHQNRLVKLDNRPDYIKLTKGEAAILANLMAHPNQIISYGKLADLVWHYDLDEIAAEKLTRLYIFRLRRKLEADSKRPLLIRTVRRRGYLFTSIRDEFPGKPFNL